MSRPVLTALLAAALAAGAAPAARAAGAPSPILPAAGTIEHVVTTTEFTGTPVKGLVPRQQREETWLSAGAFRQLVTDAKTGAVVFEGAADARRWLSFRADDDEILESAVAPRSLVLPLPTRAEQGAELKRSVEQGRRRIAGETTYDGKPALVLELVDTERPDVDALASTDVVDPTTYAPYETVSTSADRHGDRAGKPFRSVTRWESVEVLPLAGNEHLLRFGDHPGARVVDEAEQQRRADAAAARARSARQARARKAKARKAAKARARTRETAKRG